jgi:hypothetical protein
VDIEFRDIEPVDCEMMNSRRIACSDSVMSVGISGNSSSMRRG